MRNWWKMVAIIFIIFILETAFVGYGMYLVNQQEKDTLTCIIDICGYDHIKGEWTAGFYDYYYDAETRSCACFDGAGEIAKLEKFKK